MDALARSFCQRLAFICLLDDCFARCFDQIILRKTWISPIKAWGLSLSQPSFSSISLYHQRNFTRNNSHYGPRRTTEFHNVKLKAALILSFPRCAHRWMFELRREAVVKSLLSANTAERSRQSCDMSLC